MEGPVNAIIQPDCWRSRAIGQNVDVPRQELNQAARGGVSSESDNDRLKVLDKQNYHTGGNITLK